MAEKGRYVDVDALKQALVTMYVPVNLGYSNGPLESHVNQMVSQALINTLTSFKLQLAEAIEKAAKPYDKCMLCVQRDSCVPEHPLGENR